jgi:hypothetical protein
LHPQNIHQKVRGTNNDFTKLLEFQIEVNPFTPTNKKMAVLYIINLMGFLELFLQTFETHCANGECF